VLPEVAALELFREELIIVNKNELDNTSKVLLRKIFVASTAYSKGLNARKFRAENHEYLDTLDQLQSDGYLDNRDGKYFLKLVSLGEIADSTPQVGHLIFLCEHLFAVLKQCYLNRPGESIALSKLSEMADLPDRDITIGLSYMKEAPIFGGWTTDPQAENASITPSESILRYGSFGSVIETIKSWRTMDSKKATVGDILGSRNNLEIITTNYVDQQRIEELKLLESSRFDLKKLVRICEELNSCHENSNFISIACLVRTILDHIPPIFGYGTFTEVANNYGGRSLKHSLQNLENSSRKISDALLHQKIRRTESLPTKVMVDFSSDVDVLLAEIIRVID
jgi:hypothetical protein